MPGTATSIRTSRAKSRRINGSPPVRRILSIPKWRGDAHEVSRLLEREDFGPVHEDNLFRHTVDAAEIAAIRDAYSQIVVNAAESVDERPVTCGLDCRRREGSPRIVNGIIRLMRTHSRFLEGWTHSLLPSAQFSCFQIGTSSLRRSMAKRHASNASARCGQLTAAATLTSPMLSRPRR